MNYTTILIKLGVMKPTKHTKVPQFQCHGERKLQKPGKKGRTRQPRFEIQLQLPFHRRTGEKYNIETVQ